MVEEMVIFKVIVKDFGFGVRYINFIFKLVLIYDVVNRIDGSY